MNLCSSLCSKATSCLQAAREKAEDFLGRPSTKRALSTALIVSGLALPFLETATVPLSVLSIGVGIWGRVGLKRDESADQKVEERLARRKIEMEKVLASHQIDFVGRPRSLIVLAAFDDNGAFERECDVLRRWLSTTAATVVYASRVRDLATLNAEVLNTASFLFVGGHSDGTQIQLSNHNQAGASIKSQNLIELARKMPRLTDLVFFACMAAKPGGIGQEVSHALPQLRVSGSNGCPFREYYYFNSDQRPMVISFDANGATVEPINVTECTVVWEGGEAITRKVQLPAIAEYLSQLSEWLAHTRLGSSVFYAQGQICEQEQEPEKAIAVFRSTKWGEEYGDDFLKKKAEKRAAALSEQLARIEYCFT